MALLPAFAIDGGRVPASMLRMVAWVATSGADGVVTPEDFKVSALPTPGGAVSINAGGAVIPTRFGNATKQQSYIVANDQAFNLSVPAAGAAGRTDYVIVRINDPEYTGQVPGDRETALYCEVVRVTSLPTNVPYVALARINMPSNTATITNSMITDLRQVANPRRYRYTIAKSITATHALTTSSFSTFPSTSVVDVQVPEWASKVIVRADLTEVVLQGGNVDGWLLLRLGGGDGDMETGLRRYDETWSGSTHRSDHVIIGTMEIPRGYRGQMRHLQIRGRRVNGSGNLYVDPQSQVFYDIEFFEEAM